MANIEDMINAINAQAGKLSKDWQPKYIKESPWVKYNKDRFSIEDYLKANESRRETIERDVLRNYENMQTKGSLSKEKNEFMDNFNEVAEKLGIDFNVNNSNFHKFKDFIKEYEERIKNSKFKDSGAIIQMYLNFRDSRRKYNSISDFFDKIEAEEDVF